MAILKDTLINGGLVVTDKVTTPLINEFTLAAACAKGVTDSSSASAISTSTSLPTERDIYYGLPYINNSHTYTSSTSIYAPTSAGTSGYILKSSGTGNAPSWMTASSIIPDYIAVSSSPSSEDSNVSFVNSSSTGLGIYKGTSLATLNVGALNINGQSLLATYITDSYRSGSTSEYDIYLTAFASTKGYEAVGYLNIMTASDDTNLYLNNIVVATFAGHHCKCYIKLSNIYISSSVAILYVRVTYFSSSMALTTYDNFINYSPTTYPDLNVYIVSDVGTMTNIDITMKGFKEI